MVSAKGILDPSPQDTADAFSTNFLILSMEISIKLLIAKFIVQH